MQNELEKLSKETLVRKLMNIHNITVKEYKVETMCEELDMMIADIMQELRPDMDVSTICTLMAKTIDDNELNRDTLLKVYTAFMHEHTKELNQVLDKTFEHYYNEKA